MTSPPGINLSVNARWWRHPQCVVTCSCRPQDTPPHSKIAHIYRQKHVIYQTPKFKAEANKQSIWIKYSQLTSLHINSNAIARNVTETNRTVRQKTCHCLEWVIYRVAYLILWRIYNFGIQQYCTWRHNKPIMLKQDSTPEKRGKRVICRPGWPSKLVAQPTYSSVHSRQRLGFTYKRANVRI